MRFRIIKNVIKQGFQGMWRNKGMGAASVTSITAVLVILGIVLIMILSINNLVQDIETKFDEIHIYLLEDTTQAQVDNIEDKLESTEGIKTLTFKPKEQALEEMKVEWEDKGYLLEGLEKNPLPDTYIVQLEKIEYADNVAESVQGLDGIEEIQYNQDIIEKLIIMANYVRTGGLIIIAILLIISVFIISNTIKLTVTARKTEINIMKYVGATNGYIRGPFIIEGVLFGLIGAIISILIVKFGYEYFFNAASDQLYVLFTIYLVPPSALMEDIIIIFIAIGAGIGALGSLISLRKFLDV